MNFESPIGRQLFSQHQIKLQELGEQRVQERSRRIAAHEEALRTEPFLLASRLILLCVATKDYPVEHRSHGYKKVHTAIESHEDGRLHPRLHPSLGIEARLSWFGRRVVSDEIRLSFMLREGEYGDDQQVTEQPLAIVYRRSATGAQRPFGFAKYDSGVGVYADASNFETKELAGLVRQAAELASIPVLPLELPPEDQTAV